MRVCARVRAFDGMSTCGMKGQGDMARHVPKKIRPRFVQAFEGVYGWWFEFDGSVRFRDPGGGNPLPFAYGKTVKECEVMMRDFETV